MKDIFIKGGIGELCGNTIDMTILEANEERLILEAHLTTFINLGKCYLDEHFHKKARRWVTSVEDILTDMVITVDRNDLNYTIEPIARRHDTEMTEDLGYLVKYIITVAGPLFSYAQLEEVETKLYELRDKVESNLRSSVIHWFGEEAEKVAVY